MSVLGCKPVFLYWLIVIVFWGCQYSRDQGSTKDDSDTAGDYLAEVDSALFFDEHNARNSLDYAGTYAGVLPCADCEGIAVEIRIFYDGSFQKTMQYHGKSDDVFEFFGEYRWNDAGNTISLIGLEAPNQYFVAEERLIQLDIKGQRISGDLADRYVLKKTY